LAENLRKWRAGALRRPHADVPFTDVIPSTRTPREEKRIAPHPSLKPQHFLRSLVHAALPLGEGIVLDPFAGSGSTLAACEAVGNLGIGVESDDTYIQTAIKAIPRLSALKVKDVTFISDALALSHVRDQRKQDSVQVLPSLSLESKQLSSAAKLRLFH
jgi:site-specific DNA-methyltransferase (adenine-specific)